MRGLTLLAALGCGLMAGAFFAFSTFVLPALARLPAHDGVAAIQAINSAAVRSVFLAVFLGTALACILLIAATPTLPTDAGAVSPLSGQMWRLTGCALYLTGNILVTWVFNVPRNNALAEVAPAGQEGSRVWAAYVPGWTRWNHVRVVSALAAAASLTLALIA